MKKRASRIVLAILSGCLLTMMFPRAIVQTEPTPQFTPLGTGAPYTYGDIPFLINASMLSGQYEGMLSVYRSWTFKETDTEDMTGYVANKIHILQYSSYADHVPDDVIVGQVNVYYEDGTSSTSDLMLGKNTAEWAFDRPEIQLYLQHSKIPSAYSFWTDIDSGNYYWGHIFYLEIDTEQKPLDRLELFLDARSYTGQQYYGYSPADWFKIDVAAITLETQSAIRSTVSIDPKSQNLRSQGKWITAYLEFPEGFDVHNANVSTILLNGTIPVQSEPLGIGDYDNDAIPELMMRFDRAEVASYLLDNVNLTQLREERFLTTTLTIGGKLYDGTQFQGSDTVTIIMNIPRYGRLLEMLP